MSATRRRDALDLVAPHKLERPVALAAAVRRRRLLEFLDAVTCPATLITAGAGFGKSTLLSSWADTLDVPVAWLDLDRGDNDTVRLVRSVAASLHSAVGDPDLLDIGRQARPATVFPALASIETTLEGARPFVLIVDDTHEIVDPSAAEVLDGVIDVLPRGARIVLAGRTEPPIRTARRTLAGQLAAFAPSDLLFDDEEAARVLAEFDDAVEPDVLAAVAARVGGWPAGIQFAVLGLRAAMASSAPVVDPDAVTRELIAKYFQQEFLRSLSVDDRRFLTHTSVLHRLSGDLCDRVLDEPASHDHLEALVASGNAFVVPIGSKGTFRYHPLFADVLLAELRSNEPQVEAELRTRAIAWHEECGEWIAAIDVALDGGGCVPAPSLLFKYLVPRISTGEIASIGMCLEHFSPGEIRTDPLLALVAAWYALLSNRPSDMERWLEVAEAIGYDGPLPDGTADIPTAAAAVRMLAGVGGVLGTIAYARTLLDAGEAGGPWQSVASLLSADATQLSDPDADVLAMYADAEFRTRGFPPAHAVALAHLAIAHLERRQVSDANRLIALAREEVEAHGLTNLNLVSMVYCATALVRARTGSHAASAEAAQHATALLEAVDTVHSRSHIHHRLILADAAIARNDWSDAAALTAVVGARIDREPDAVVLQSWYRRTAQRCSTHDRLGPAGDLTAAEQRVLEQLASHRTLAEIGTHLYVSRNTVKSHTVSIYRKLAVTGRSEAVERGYEVGLIDDGHGTDRAVASIR